MLGPRSSLSAAPPGLIATRVGGTARGGEGRGRPFCFCPRTVSPRRLGTECPAAAVNAGQTCCSLLRWEINPVSAPGSAAQAVDGAPARAKPRATRAARRPPRGGRAIPWRTGHLGDNDVLDVPGHLCPNAALGKNCW